MSQSKPTVRWGYRFLRGLSRLIFKLYFRGRVLELKRVPETGGVLLACNHQSFLDPVAAALALPRECHFMARDTLFRNPLFGRLIVYLNAFPVKRGAADISAVKEILRRLRNEAAVVVFLEATRTRDGSIGKINANSLSIAKKAGVPIVPTFIDGAFEAFPRGSRWPRPRKIRVTYAEAITDVQAREWPVERIVETVTQRLHEIQQQSPFKGKGGPNMIHHNAASS